MFNIKPQMVLPRSLDKNVLYADLPISGIPINKNNWDEKRQINNKEVFQNEINEFGFRSSNFKKQHSGKHILFLGCSYTWGTGLFIDEVWSKIVYEQIKIDQHTDDYFNLAIPGDSIYISIINAFKYFKNFSNPDIIFFNIQNLERFFAYDKHTNKLFRSIIEDNEILTLLAYHYYYMLEQYCQINNIKLLSFSWSEKCNEYFQKFSTFYPLDFQEMHNFVTEFCSQLSNDDACMIARDGKHLGFAYHKYWAKHIYKQYEDAI